jgi:uncharacterized protein
LLHHALRQLMLVAATPPSRSFSIAHCRTGPAPFQPSDVVAGDPRARSVNMIASADGQFDCGVWECSPGRFSIRYRSDELVHILEGNVTVHVGSSTHSLAAGDVAYFPAGTDAEWHVIAHVKKLWVYRTPRPRRLARVARPLLRALSRAGF